MPEPGARHQRERPHAPRVAQREGRGDEPAERMADEVGALDLPRREELPDRRGERIRVARADRLRKQPRLAPTLRK